MKKEIVAILICILLIVSSLVIVYPIKALNVNGNTLYVGGNGSGNYTRIQNAIDNASHGDTIFVYNGIYHESIVVDKSISLIGENKSKTIIDGKSRVVKITYDNVTVSGFTIRNGSGGIKIFSNYNTISENIITNNKGNGIIITTSSNNEGCYNLITRNIISDNGAEGIWCQGGSYNTISYNLIFNNWYGIYIGWYKCEGNKIYGNYITNNRLFGILMNSFYASETIIESNSIEFNKEGIFIAVSEPGSTLITKNNFIGNIVDARFGYLLIYYIKKPFSDRWSNNYWGETGQSFKIIHGELLIPDIRPFYTGIEIPWVVFDWNPAQEPYDIPIPDIP